MSSNDQVVIIEKDYKFYIYHNLCIDNDFKPTKNNLLKIKDTLKEAINFASSFCNEYPYVEYGYTIQLQDNTQVKKESKSLEPKVVKTKTIELSINEIIELGSLLVENKNSERLQRRSGLSYLNSIEIMNKLWEAMNK